MIGFERTEKSTLEIWAEKETAMACERERASNSKEDWDYGGVACYESALRAFQSLLRDGHSGFSISLTQNILNRLIDGKPLTPITEKNAEWKDISWHGLNDGVQKFQSGRMSSLFKEIHPDGTVTYSDVERFVCVDEDGHGCYHSSLVDRVVSKIFPITFPYCSASYKIYCSDCLTDHRNGDFDTVAIFYAIDEKGTRTDIYRYFKACLNDWREIERLEWTRRKAKAGILRRRSKMNGSKIIADNSNKEEVIQVAIRDMATLQATLIDYSEAKKRNAPTGEIEQQLESVTAKSKMALRALTIMFDSLEIRGEVTNGANNSIEKSARKIIDKKEE